MTVRVDQIRKEISLLVYLTRELLLVNGFQQI